MFSRKKAADYDLVVIGGGSAAFAAATKAAEADASVLIVEKETIGGTCVNRGCVPSKNVLHAAELYHEYHSGGGGFPGIPSGTVAPNFDEIFKQKEALVDELRRARYLDIIDAFPNIEVAQEKAHFLDSETVQVNGRRVTARMFLIATGASPAVPPIPGLDGVHFMTYRDALSPQSQPKSLAIIGGGPIGLELGQAYARLGTRVVVVEAMPHLLPDHEPEISAAIRDYLSAEGLEFYTDSNVAGVEKTATGIQLRLESKGGGSGTHVEAEALLVATGTVPNTRELDCEAASVRLSTDGAVAVDAQMRTSNRRVFSAGDVTGSPMLVTTAARQGGIAVANGLLGQRESYDARLVPHAVFTTPQVASVGLMEAGAKSQGIKTVAATLDFKNVPRANAVRNTRGVLKIVVNEKTAQLVGMHAACPQAAELIHTGLFMIQSGVTIGDILRTTFIYPTMSEAIKIAAISLKKDVSLLSCCAS